MTKKKQTIGQIVPLKGQERLLKLAKAALSTPKGKIPTLADIATAVASVMNSTEEGLWVNSEEQRELTSALLFYDVRAKKMHLDNSSVQSLINSILPLFRRNVSRYGYTKLPLSMVVIAEHYGTLKDKITLCIQYFDYQREDGGSRNPVSKRRAERIRASIWEQGDETTHELQYGLGIYDTYTSISAQYATCKAMYQVDGLKAALYLQNFEWLDRVITLSNAVKEIVSSASINSTFSKIKLNSFVDLRDQYLKDNFNFGELLHLNLGKKEKVGTLQYADELLIEQGVKPSLSVLKGMITAIAEWAKDNGDADYLFMPYDLKQDIIDPVNASTIEEIGERFYIGHLYELEVEGKPISNTDKHISTFPSYDDVEADAETKQQTIEKLDETLKEEYKQIQ